MSAVGGQDELMPADRGVLGPGGTRDAAVPFRPAEAPGADERPGLAGLDRAAIATWMSERGHATYRARQVLDAIWSSWALPANRWG